MKHFEFLLYGLGNLLVLWIVQEDIDDGAPEDHDFGFGAYGYILQTELNMAKDWLAVLVLILFHICRQLSSCCQGRYIPAHLPGVEMLSYALPFVLLLLIIMVLVGI